MLSNAKTFTLMLMIFSDLDHHRHHREEEFFRDPVLARHPHPPSRQSQGLVDHDIDDDDDDGDDIDDGDDDVDDVDDDDDDDVQTRRPHPPRRQRQGILGSSITITAILSSTMIILDYRSTPPLSSSVVSSILRWSFGRKAKRSASAERGQREAQVMIITILITM